MRRRTLLFVPGNNPGMLVNSPVFGSDGLIFDLEDAVAQDQKDSARILVRNALSSVEMGEIEKIVRINSMDRPFWKDDVFAVVEGGADTIMLPKAQTGEEMVQLAEVLEEAEVKYGRSEGSIPVIALIETPLGMEHAFDIATSPRVNGILLGAEDLTSALGVPRTLGGQEIFYSRGRLVMAARAAGIDVIDTPFTDTDDMDGLREDTIRARSLGFDGKALISPRHVEEVNNLFTPSEDELKWASRVVEALELGEKMGKGAVSVDGKMVDAPVAARAKKILALGDRG